MELEKWQAKKFEDIKYIDENGQEHWLGRELQNVLGYAQHRKNLYRSCKKNR